MSLLCWKMLQVERSPHVRGTACSSNNGIIITIGCTAEGLQAKFYRKIAYTQISAPPPLYPMELHRPPFSSLLCSPGRLGCKDSQGIATMQLPALASREPQRGEKNRREVGSNYLFPAPIQQVVVATSSLVLFCMGHSPLDSSSLPSKVR